MIKSITVERDKSCEPLKYPVLMESHSLGLIVLFISERHGFVVGGDMYGVGHVDEHWTSATRRDVWNVFSGKVVLTND